MEAVREEEVRLRG